ncbi:OPT superfamily oligopeptide transporter [Thozetella sp. PMI_491]|nr:OPT superfamily oligopeptide transporter [Thozetella sp. PMI_491]
MPAAVRVASEKEIEGATEEIIDLFEPLPPNPGQRPEASRVLTVRALVLGCVLGTLVNASNLYLGLRSGITFTASMFGTLLGFVVLKLLSHSLSESFPILGGYFGPRENNIVHTAAVTSGGLSFIFITGVPAFYQLGLMSQDPQDDYWRLVTFTLICAYYGMLFAIPMRNFFLRTAARDWNLIFPSNTAIAVMIKGIHAAGTGLDDAKKKIKVLGYAFTWSFIHRVVSQYAIGILWDWHVFVWQVSHLSLPSQFFIWSGYTNGTALTGDGWTWYIELTPAFFGYGMLVGLNIGLSGLLGSILAWGIIGPSLVASGVAAGVQPAPDTKWGPYTVYTALSPGLTPGTLPSPRYWLLWPGIMIMLFASVAEILSLYKVVYRVTKASLSGLRLPTRRSVRQLFRKSEAEPLFEGDQPVPWWIWLPAVILLIIVSCVILALQYEMGIGETLVTLILGFIFAFLGVQCQGAADQSPTTAIAKVGQLIIGGMSNVHNTPATAAQRINLAAAQISGGSTYAAVELISDLRVGYLLGTPVPQQIITQAAGNLIAILISPLIFILFTKAYPCILNSGDPTCEFKVPAAAAWGSLAKVVTSADFPLPKSSAIFSLVMGIFALLIVLFKNFYLIGERTKYRKFVPNLPVIGLAFVTPFVAFNIVSDGPAVTMAAGAIAGYIWKKKDPRRYEAYVYSLAAGAVAGEGIGGVVNAILELGKVGGSKYGSKIACPLDSC